MTYLLGVDIGTSYTAAATWRLDAGQQNTADVVPLGTRGAAVASVLFLGADGALVVGEAAERRALSDPDRVVREFKRRIGDDTPLFVGGKPHAAHDLAATMVRWVVDRVTEREGGPPERIAITHPAGWGPYKKDLLRSALGLPELTLLAEPAAAAVSYASQERVEPGTTIAVYDLGGGTFDAAVVRKTAAGSFTLLGSAEGIEHLGGVDFDEAVFNHVRAALEVQLETAQLDALDLEDPGTLGGLTRLRRECTEAKEALSADTEVSIPVLLPGINTNVRLVRGEFEEMIRPAVEDTVDALSRAIRSADLTSADLGKVLLVGGSSRIPLVAQLVSAQLGRPVAADTDPKTTIALGAALSLVHPRTPTSVSRPTPDRPRTPDAGHSADRPSPAVAVPAASTAPAAFTAPAALAAPGAPRRRRVRHGVLLSIVMTGLIASSLLMLSAWKAQGSFLPTLDDLIQGIAPTSSHAPDPAGPGDRAKSDHSGSPGATGSGADGIVAGSGSAPRSTAPSAQVSTESVTVPVAPVSSPVTRPSASRQPGTTRTTTSQHPKPEPVPPTSQPEPTSAPVAEPGPTSTTQPPTSQPGPQPPPGVTPTPPEPAPPSNGPPQDQPPADNPPTTSPPTGPSG